jgi:hypothetical protein
VPFVSGGALINVEAAGACSHLSDMSGQCSMRAGSNKE